MTLQTETRTTIEQARDRYPHPRSAILPALWAVQHELGQITPDAMAEVATILRVAPSEVQAVSTFYSMYFQHPHGRHEVIVCINVSCALRGAEGIVDHLERSLGCASGETTADGEFTWSSTVECLGGCGGAPVMQVDHHFVEDLTPDRVDAVLGALRGSGAADGSPHNAGPVVAGTPRRRAPGGAPALPPATPPAAQVEPSVGPSTAPPVVASADQVGSAKRSARKSAPPVRDVSAAASVPRGANAPLPEVASGGAADASSDLALPLTTPKEPDPAATTAPQAKGRGRRPSKDAQ
jgi:NADH-quinone oxidoreductase subunit E